MNKKSVRLFYALELSETLKESVHKFIVPYKNSSSMIKWVNTKNLHLTLRFLGTVYEETIPLLASIIKSITIGEKIFIFSLRGIGIFPTLRKPSVLWVGVDNGAKECKKFASKINTQLTYIGIKTESSIFKPHITIGRSKKNVNIHHLTDLCQRIIESNTNTYIGESLIDSISLVHSTLTNNGSIYTTIAKSYFK